METIETRRTLQELGLANSENTSDDITDYILREVFIPMDRIYCYYEEEFCGRKCTMVAVEDYDFIVDILVDDLTKMMM
jgi:hypothetical protein